MFYLSCNASFPFLFAEAGVQTNGNKRKSQVLKIGHGGTLDSAATGVLGNEKYKYSYTMTSGNIFMPTWNQRWKNNLGYTWQTLWRWGKDKLLEKSDPG